MQIDELGKPHAQDSFHKRPRRLAQPAVRQVDRNNVGPSQGIALGDFSGGALWVADQGSLDTHGRWSHGARGARGQGSQLTVTIQASRYRCSVFHMLAF